MARLQRYSNMGPLTRSTFQVTRPEGKSDKPEDQELFRRGYEIATAFAEDPRGWLVLTGPSGSGKTHLAAAIANRVLEGGNPVFFVFVPDLLDHLRSAFAPTSEISFDQLFEQVRNAPFLVLDDLGGHSSTPWAQEKLYQILNFRYAYQMPTVFTLGAPVEELENRWQTRLADPETATICPLSVAERTKAYSQIGMMDTERLREMTFDKFDVRGNRANDQQRAALDAACKFAMNYAQDPEGWLVFLGPTGCGKTHLVHAIANERFKQGQGVLYFRVADLLDYLRDAYRPDSTLSNDWLSLFQEMRNSSLLVLEDYATHNATPWAREKLLQILFHRHYARLPTIITSTDFDQEDRADPVMSRLRDLNSSVVTIPIDAPDYRNNPPKDRLGYRYRGRG